MAGLDTNLHALSYEICSECYILILFVSLGYKF